MDTKNKQIYKGSNKTLYESGRNHALILSFDDNFKMPNNEHIEVAGKGIINNSISSYIMEKLDFIGIDNHFIKKINMRQQLVQFVDTYPIQIHICTVSCGRYVTNFDIERGFVFNKPIIDFRVKNKKLGYPSINEEQIISFEWLDDKELQNIKSQAIRIYDFLSGLFISLKIRLVDIKLEFGKVFNGEKFVTMLADEISPDTCRLWDMETNEKLSYEVAEDCSDKLIPAYKEVLTRLSP